MEHDDRDAEGFQLKKWQKHRESARQIERTENENDKVECQKQFGQTTRHDIPQIR